MVPAISFVGHHNSGKTTVLVKVIRHLTAWKIRTAVIKHSQHGFDLPREKDSERLFQAGSGLVYASSPRMSLRYRREGEERDLADIYAELMGEVDLVITEGYKTGPFPKIEVARQATGNFLPGLTDLIARVTDMPVEDGIACFGFDQDTEIARFIAEKFQLM